MQYLITNDIPTMQSLRTIFKDSYHDLLGCNCDSIFDRTLQSAFCASIILDSSSIVAFSFHREMICSDWENPPDYMSDVPGDFLRQVENAYRFLTIEWLTVHPERLGKFSKVQPGDLILGLGFRLMASSHLNATIGFSRQDTRVDIMTTRFGADLRGTVKRLGIDCSVVFLEASKLAKHPIKQTQDQIDALWISRTNLIPQIERQIGA